MQQPGVHTTLSNASPYPGAPSEALLPATGALATLLRLLTPGFWVPAVPPSQKGPFDIDSPHPAITLHFRDSLLSPARWLVSVPRGQD